MRLPKIFSSLGLAAKVAFATAGLVSLLSAASALLAIYEARTAVQATVDMQVNERILVLARAYELADKGAKMERGVGTQVLKIRVSDLPKDGDHSIVDLMVDGASLQKLDPVTGDLIRFSSSVRNPKGERLIGSRTPASSPLSQSIAKGQAINDYIVVGGIPRVARYIPLINAEGRVLGALVTGIMIAEADEVLRKAITAIIVLFGLLMVLASLSVFILVRRSLRPVSMVTQVVCDLADDKPIAPLPFAARGDEIGILSRAVDRLVVILSERAAMREKEALSAQADEAKRIRMERSLAEFDRAIRDVVDKVVSRSKAVGQSTANVSASTTHAQQNTRETVSATQDTVAGVTGIAGATEELNAAISEIRRQTESAVSVTQDATHAVSTATQDASTLATNAEKIGQVVQLIRAIAEQTNLLALNATIEAARAGEAGKGFAVVAAEVKQLASQTAKATEDIGIQVSAIQDATQRTVSSMNSMSATIAKMQQASSAISSAIEQQAGATGEIAGSVEQTAGLARQAGHAIDAVSAGLSEVGVSVQSLNDVATGLDEDVNSLRNAVSTFLADVKAA